MSLLRSMKAHDGSWRLWPPVGRNEGPRSVIGCSEGRDWLPMGCAVRPMGLPASSTRRRYTGRSLLWWGASRWSMGSICDGTVTPWDPHGSRGRYNNVHNSSGVETMKLHRYSLIPSFYFFRFCWAFERNVLLPLEHFGTKLSCCLQRTPCRGYPSERLVHCSWEEQ